ncbi:putative membrane protein DUF2306 [Flavobacteriaceae bacterium MAR_2010_72]|nr:putative membrane protein DUF2306 [Flavobacteriaceae bacterium MAR_2010_72]
MKIVLRYFFIIFSVLIVLILVWASIEKLIKFHTLINNPELFSKNIIEYHYRDHLVLGYLHIIPGLLFLVLGGYQFIPYFRKKNYKIHRLIGKIFLSLSAFIFITAIILALFVPFGNWLETVVTVVFGSFLLFCVYKAYFSARNKKIKVHQNWVIRIYFISIAVSTIRGTIALFMIFGDDSLQSAFGKSFLIAFLVHLFFVELYIRFLKN